MMFRSKIDWIGRHVDKSLSVLDLGCVCHDLEQTAVPWLHDDLRQRAGRIVGVDYLPEPVAELKQRGYDVVCADVQQMDLGEQFDRVVAGDIIEHLDNVGLFLDRVHAHLKPGGLFLVTTPNPVNLVRFVRILIKGSAGANKEHTCWFTAKVLRQLAQRHGFEAIEEAYVNDTHLFYPWFKPAKQGTPVRKFFRQLNRFLGMLFFWKIVLFKSWFFCHLRERCAETLCMAFRPTEK